MNWHTVYEYDSEIGKARIGCFACILWLFVVLASILLAIGGLKWLWNLVM